MELDHNKVDLIWCCQAYLGPVNLTDMLVYNWHVVRGFDIP